VVRSTLPSSVTSFECWWPAARGNPASVGRARQSSQRDPHRKRPAKAACVWCRREEMPRRHPSHSLCCPATRKGNACFPHSSTRIHSSGGGFVASGMNGQEGSRPQRWGTATDEEQTFEGWSTGGNVDLVRVIFGWRRRLYGNPVNPRSGTGMQQARSLRCGGNRRSGEIPQGRNGNRGRHTVVRTRAQARGEWTHVGTPEEGHPTISREDDFLSSRCPATDPSGVQGSARCAARRR
jgi:hypothetical protein